MVRSFGDFCKYITDFYSLLGERWKKNLFTVLFICLFLQFELKNIKNLVSSGKENRSLIFFFGGEEFLFLCLFWNCGWSCRIETISSLCPCGCNLERPLPTMWMWNVSHYMEIINWPILSIKLKEVCSDWLLEINKCLNKLIISQIPPNKKTEFIIIFQTCQI